MCFDIDCEKITHRTRKLGRWSKALLLLSIISSIAFAIYTIRPLVDRHRHYVPPSSTRMLPVNSVTKLNLDDMNDVVISVLSFVVLIFQLIHVVLGTFYYNIYELFGMLLTQFLITLIVVLPLIRDLTLHLDDYVNVIVCAVIILCQITFLVFAVPLYREFSWRFYRVFGSDTEYRARIRNYMKFVVLLRVDLVMWITIAIASHHFVSDDYAWEFGIDALALVSSLTFVLIGYFAHKKESVALVASFWTLSFVGPVYLVHVYRDIWSEIWFLARIVKTHQRWKLDNALLFMFLTIGLAIISVRITLMVFSILTTRDFGKSRDVKESRGLVNGEGIENYEDIEYEGIDVEYDNSDSDKEAGSLKSGRGKVSDDLTFEDVVRNTHRYAATPSSNELPDISSYSDRKGGRGKGNDTWW